MAIIISTSSRPFNGLRSTLSAPKYAERETKGEYQWIIRRHVCQTCRVARTLDFCLMEDSLRF
jgi:hypothetical protein